MNLDFETFFEAIWGHSPYPWQSELASRVVSAGWPRVLDLPTGTGKTAALDIALYHLLVDGGKTAPRRVILVVDRRVIVDQVGDRVEHLKQALEDALAPGPLASARDRLRRIVGPDVPLLESATMRGGMPRSDAWIRHPQVPVLAASTVDQVGSRLLFRGYGVSRGMQPLHAGLMGCDTLLLLDEVHLSRPFATILDDLARLRGEESAVPRRSGVVELSATPGTKPSAAAGAAFGLDEADRATPRLAALLRASKPAALEQVKVRARAPEPDKREVLAAAAADHARAMVDEGRGTVAVVVNRVDTARRVWRHLHEDPALDVALITGRMRPLDQAETLAEVRSRVEAGRPAQGEARPLVLVATQTIEAGADYDFDGMVSECAPLDALRQRFGRVDRRGEATARLGASARGVILARSDMKSTDDRVYGEAPRLTWEWLEEIAEDGSVDFGIDAVQHHLDDLDSERRQAMTRRDRAEPVLLPTHMEQWAQTAPRPHADPDVSLFLHGIPRDDERVAADVRIVWRADVTETDLSDAREPTARDELLQRLAVVPPGSQEAISLPLWSLRRWLSRSGEEVGEDELSDVEGMAAPHPRAGGALVLQWQGRRDSEVVPAADVPPGAMIVVPADRGGIGEHRTFDPDSTTPVRDLGDVVQWEQRGRPTLRLDEVVWSALKGLFRDRDSEGPEAELEEAADILDRVKQAVEREGDDALRRIADALGPSPRLVNVEVGGNGRVEEEDRPSRASWVLLGSRASSPASDDQPFGIAGAIEGGEEDDETFLGVDRDLEGHLEGVARRTVAFAEALHLPPTLRTTLRWAARLHDLGKLDPRFQLLLHGGDPVAARFGPRLAKSRIPSQDAPARSRARRIAKYPEGQRHELVSLAMVQGSEALRARVEADDGDWDLVLHLIATHHGHARPLAPFVAMSSEEGESVSWTVDGVELEGSTAHGAARADSGIADRMFRLADRYGWHEMAYLEAILRLADHRQSEFEETLPAGEGDA